MPTVIGFTGAFGSGCTTAAKHLRDQRHFVRVALSDAIRDEWRDTTEPMRADLQSLGNEIREDQGSGALVDKVMDHLYHLPDLLVVDGIKNRGEVERLRDRYGYDFTLIAVLADRDSRWARIGSEQYADRGLSDADFIEDDARDQGEETSYGQQVELCVDTADVILDNSGSVTLTQYRQKVLEYADLLTGQKMRQPTKQERLMHMAYSSAHGSKCLKRNVGAVLADDRGQLVSAGYNENPLGTNPCVEEESYGYSCYRDIVRNEHFRQLGERNARCPECGAEIGVIEGPPWVCPKCRLDGIQTNLESFYFPDRAMNWCTAVHAEVWAIMTAGERAAGTVLYTTTFPCFQCAEKIIQAQVAKVVFTEAYPDVYSADRLALAGIPYEQFEGVRSSAFERVFSPSKPS